jgi:hypothetical protein
VELKATTFIEFCRTRRLKPSRALYHLTEMVREQWRHAIFSGVDGKIVSRAAYSDVETIMQLAHGVSDIGTAPRKYISTSYGNMALGQIQVAK